VPRALDRGVEDACAREAGSVSTCAPSLSSRLEREKDERTLEADLVPPERVHRALEESRILGRVARDVELLELDGDVGVLLLDM